MRRAGARALGRKFAFSQPVAHLISMKYNVDAGVSTLVHDFILEKSAAKEETRVFPADPFWKGLRDTGTGLWLDTGDMEAAARQWTDEFSALTTNNTLLNKEVQKGIYDEVIREAGRLLGPGHGDQRVMEVAFILNALHGLRLVKVFNAQVSVELHTATADDVEAAVAYGRRFARISPSHFIVKVPLTAAGFIATRILRAEGIPVNFTLGFSARQNYLVGRFRLPQLRQRVPRAAERVRCDNALGDGLLVGEKATLASQAAVSRLAGEGRRCRSPRACAAARRCGTSPEWT